MNWITRVLLVGCTSMPTAGSATALASPGRSRFARLIDQCTRGLLQALHESRRLEGERAIARYRHLVADANQPAE